MILQKGKTKTLFFLFILFESYFTQPVIQVQYCQTNTIPVGYVVYYQDCRIVHCMIGCKKCSSTLSCDECYPGLIYYGGGLKDRPLLSCIPEWERDILIKIYSK